MSRNSEETPWWWAGDSPRTVKRQVVCWALVAVVGIILVLLGRLLTSEPMVWLGAIQLLTGGVLASSAVRTLRALRRGDTNFAA